MGATVEASSSHPLLDELKRCGADQADPVRFRYLQALERRLRTKDLQHTPHWQKLEQALVAYKARYERPYPSTNIAESSQSSPLAALLALLNQPPIEPATAPGSALEQRVFSASAEGAGLAPQQATTAPPQSLKAMARVRANQDLHALEARIRCAIEQIPIDAGPMNAHRLVSRAMAEMQRLSPAYLNRFVNYTDSLMALERLGRKGQ